MYEWEMDLGWPEMGYPKSWPFKMEKNSFNISGREHDFLNCICFLGISLDFV